MRVYCAYEANIYLYCFLLIAHEHEYHLDWFNAPCEKMLYWL